MDYLAALILALAVSIDGLTVGLTYGLKKIKITLLPLLIISIASGITMLIAISFGQFLKQLIAPIWAERIGGIILIVVGVYLFYQSIKFALANNLDKELKREEIKKELFTIKISSLGLIINILQEPVKADFDDSGVISKKEALILGFALAMDAFGGGIGAGLAGYNPIFTAVAVCLFKFLLVNLGIHSGQLINNTKLGKKLRLFPGLILVALGIIQLF